MTELHAAVLAHSVTFSAPALCHVLNIQFDDFLFGSSSSRSRSNGSGFINVQQVVDEEMSGEVVDVTTRYRRVSLAEWTLELPSWERGCCVLHTLLKTIETKGVLARQTSWVAKSFKTNRTLDCLLQN